MHTARRVSIITIGFGLLVTRLEAQTPGDHLLYQDTLQQRMQRSVSRQVESASRMQAALDLQRQTVQRQTGDVAAVGPFFTVPGIPGIPAIAGIDSGGIIAAKSVRAALGERKEGEVDRLATAGATALRNAGGPYIQQLLQAMGGDGATALPSPLGPQQNAAGN